MQNARAASFAILTLACGGCIAGGMVEGDTVPESRKVKVGTTEGRLVTLDDFESGATAAGTEWETKAGGTDTRLDPEPFSPEACGPEQTKSKACAHIHGHYGPDAPPWPEATLTLPLNPAFKEVDLTPARALRFWVKGDGRQYSIALRKRSAKEWNHHAFIFTAPDEWTQIEAPIEAFAQPDWGARVPRVFDDVFDLQIKPAVHNADFDVYVDDLQFVVDRGKKFVFRSVDRIEERSLEEIARSGAKYTTVSLASVANRDFQDDEPGNGKGGWTDDGDNSVPGFPTGKQTFLGVPFEVSPTQGHQVLVLRGQKQKALPTNATIPVHGRGRAVYFLHAAGWGSPDNGRYVVKYDDGSRSEIDLSDGMEVFDFWRPNASPVARVAWTGANPRQKPIGLTLFAWRNPKPDVEIAEIVASTPGDNSFLMVAGITLASDGPFLTKLPVVTFDDPTWFAYEGIDVAQRRGTALDMSRRLDAPAGKHGALQAKGDDFVFADGTKARFWGMNVTDNANAPTHAEADHMAELCAQLGFNMVRHHLMDAAWNTRNIFGSGKEDTQSLDPAWLDDFDYFLAQLAKRGIYSQLDLQTMRKPLAKDGLADPERTAWGYKMVGEFDPKLIALQERFAEQLLTHRNKYTGKTVAEDPSIVLITIVNESSLFFLGDWGQGEMNGPHHRELLKKLWNGWLTQKFPDRAALEKRWAARASDEGKRGLAADEDPARGTVAAIMDFSERTKEYRKFTRARVRDNYQFLYDTEAAFAKRLTAVVRKAGFKGLVTGSNHWMDQPIDIKVNTQTDYIDRHGYFAIPGNGSDYKAGVSFGRDALVKESAPDKNVVALLAAKRVKGLPYIVSEWNDLQPAHRTDAALMTAALSSFNGWSALQYAFTGTPFSQDKQVSRRLGGIFIMKDQATVLALWPALSLLVERGDVRPSDELYERGYSDDEVYDPSTRVRMPELLPFVARTAIGFGTGSKPREAEALLAKHVKGRVATSTTGELVTDFDRGIFQVDAPRTQGATGFLAGQGVRTKNVELKVDNRFATVLVSSLDDKPIADAARMLVTAAGNTVNKGLTLTPEGVIKFSGTPPILIEPIVGTVTVRGLRGDAAKIVVHRLNASGKRMGTVPSRVAGDAISFDLKPEHKAMHYELAR